MSEKADLSVKKSEGKEKGPVSSSSKTNLSQSADLNSPMEQVLHLQRTIGNRAVTRLIQSGVLQAKLKIGQPGDVYEQEADRVAEQVMRMQETKQSLVQAKPICPECTEEKNFIQTKPLAGQITASVQGAVGQIIQMSCSDHPDESYYRGNPSYCRDTASTGRLHPNHRCYREIPGGEGCPPGEHVCFRNDTGACDPGESHVDGTAPTLSGGGGNCEVDYTGWCSIMHFIRDVAPPYVAEGLELSGRGMIENMRWTGSKM